MDRTDIYKDVSLWNVGDIVSRDGTDEHKIIAFHMSRQLIDVECTKEPDTGWTSVGDVESNMPKRYLFIGGKMLDRGA